MQVFYFFQFDHTGNQPNGLSSGLKITPCPLQRFRLLVEM